VDEVLVVERGTVVVVDGAAPLGGGAVSGALLVGVDVTVGAVSSTGTDDVVVVDEVVVVTAVVVVVLRKRATSSACCWMARLVRVGGGSGRTAK
jgi:hypothetical protein